MTLRLLTKSFLFVAAFTHVQAASSILLEVGQLKNSSGAAVLSGSWILILNESNSNVLPGGMAATSASPDANLTSANTMAVAQDFSGKTLDLGSMIGTGSIRAIGTITPENDPDYGGGFGVSGTINFANGEEGRAYGVYWIPGFAPGDTLPTSGMYQVGGIFRSSSSASAQFGTFSPPAPQDNVATGFNTNTINAIVVTAIPEPTTLLLSSLGLVALFRRSRNP